MTLAPGTRLGSHEIVAPLGAGGMGEVYRAHDTRLGRDVAIKVLPAAFAADKDRMARFEREAHVLASLSHPHIAVLYGFEEREGLSGLVMELVEGPTLGQRLEPGAMSPEEALPLAREIAEALEYAHERGIVHRDLKPANVKLTGEGAVKLLDFGLAKALEDPHAPQDAERSPTLSVVATRAGVILGTAGYMSPEQAKGKPADRRADVWAFGVLLYEMLSGKPLYRGETASETLALVITQEPDWTSLPQTTPPSVRELIRRSLIKDPRKRLQAIGEARLVIEEHLTGASGTSLVVAAAPAVSGQAALRKRAMLGTRDWVLAGVGLGVLAVTAAAAGWFLKPAPPPPARVLTRFPIALPRGQDLTRTGRHVVALSPDGSKLVYVANNQLYLRPMDQLEASPIRGTDGDAASPFFSPDGQWIGFWTKGQLKKIPVGGGGAVTLCQADIPYGASWTGDRILFGEGPLGIFEVPANGGAPKTIVRVDRKEAAHGPQLLPGGDAVLFTLRPEGRTTWDEARAVVQSLKSGERKVLIERATDVRYVNTGHLVYVHAATLFAVPFDVVRLAIAGGAVAVTEGVWEPGWIGTAQFAVSSAGTLAYVPGAASASIKRTLVWVDRNGVEEPIPAPPHAYAVPRLSPDGSRVVLELNEQENDQWIWDFTRGTLTRLTFGPATDWQGTWTPDGRRIIFSSDPGGHRSIYWRAADGTGAVELLAKGPEAEFGYPSPDGRLLVAVGTRSAKTKRDLSLVHLDGDRRVEPLLESEFNEVNPAVSPNGRWLAYQSDESGQWEVYVRPFPDIDKGRWQISVNWGANPFWGHDGRELFYNDIEIVFVTPVSNGPTFVAGRPAPLFSRRKYFGFALSRDGRRFLAVKPDQPAQTQLLVVQHWFDELKARVPGK